MKDGFNCLGKIRSKFRFKEGLSKVSKRVKNSAKTIYHFIKVKIQKNKDFFNV